MMTVAAAPTRRIGRFIDTLTAIFVLMGIGIFTFNLIQPITVLPRLAPAPGYRLTDQHGNIVDSETQRGKLTLYSFTATNCDECEQTLTQIADVVDDMDERVTPVTFVLAGEPPPAAWTLLTASPATMKAVVGGGFDLYYTEDGQFAPRWVLVDTLGQMRARYHTAQPDLAILQRDIGLLLAEKENSAGIGRLGYEAAHLFACYPK